MATPPPIVAALIVAGGRGTRAGSHGSPPKQYARLAGRTVLTRTIEAFADHVAIDAIQVVIHPADLELYEAAIAPLVHRARQKLRPVAFGGVTRQGSVAAGLVALAAQAPTSVLIHDAARPFVDAAVIDRIIAALGSTPAVIAALPVADTLKRGDQHGCIAGTVAREGLWRAQTPQAFDFLTIRAAHARATAAGRADFTDDAAIAEWAGQPVQLVEGSARNIKLTTAEDMTMAERLLGADAERETRTGQGFDVHRFAAGDHVWLGGVRIPHTDRLDGHSDADVALHALTDALLGTIGDGDIGQHFPPSDPRWKGASSHLFLADAARRVAERGGRIVNVDLTILCEAPRIGPYRIAMQNRIGEVLGLAPDRIGIKATTTEQLGFTGRREGIAAMAIATVSMPRD